MKRSWYRSVLSYFSSMTLVVVLSTCQLERNETERYNPAPASYAILAEKSLDLMASLDLETWSTMLSDSVVYYLPDGDIKTCTKLSGKKAVLQSGREYIEASGLKSMSIEDATYLPINIVDDPRPGRIQGTQVIAYFSNKMIYHQGAVALKMNMIIHFDKNRMIDGYYSYYDTAPVVEVLGDSLSVSIKQVK